MYYGVGTKNLDAQVFTGGLVRNFSPGTNVVGLAIGPDGTVYVTCAGGSLYALNPDGTERWRVSRDADIRTSVAVLGPAAPSFSLASSAKKPPQPGNCSG